MHLLWTVHDRIRNAVNRQDLGTSRNLEGYLPAVLRFNAEFRSIEPEALSEHMEWSPKLRQAVKAQISFNEDESHEPVSKKVHERI